MNYRVIIFDFFGVISSEVAPFWFAKYFPQEQIAELKEKYVYPADRGEISYKQFIDQIAQAAAVSPDDAKKEWNDLVIINEEVVAFIKKIKSIYKVGLLSDDPSEFLKGILRAHNLENLFDFVVISSEIGVAKPDQAFFKKALKIINASQEEVFFIDDNQENVQAAEKLGIQGVMYKDIETLKIFKK